MKLTAKWHAVEVEGVAPSADVFSLFMADQQPDTRGDVVDERGIVITAAGRERVRRQLAELDAQWTPERSEQARRDFLARLDAA